MPATVVEASDRAKVRRGERFAARHTLWSESGLSRVRSCGRAVQSNGVGVSVKVTDGHAGYGNLQTCGSVWACPVCSAKIASVRQSEIQQALTAWASSDLSASKWANRGRFGRVALVTLTMRHRKGQSLDSLWSALSESWNLAASGAGWATDQLIFGTAVKGRAIKSGVWTTGHKVKGSIPIIRVVEVTEGANGWHVHVHALLMLPSWADDDSVRSLGASMWGRWLAGLEARGLDCDRSHGVDARLLHGDAAAALGEYFVKATYSASMEVARSDMKRANHGNRTPFAVLADLVRSGDADDLDTWREYERGSKGRRQIFWSHGLRAALLPVAEVLERTDAEIAADDGGGQVVADIERDVWRYVVGLRQDWSLLQAFERSIPEGLSVLQGLRVRCHAADFEAAPVVSEGVVRRLQTRYRR